MLCDELKVYVPQDGPWGLEPEEGGQLVEEETCYLKSEVDAAIDDLKTEHHKERDEYISMVYSREQTIKELKKKLEDVQASAYAESVDAGMRDRRLRRALWLKRADDAKHLVTAYENYDYFDCQEMTIKQETARTWMTCKLRTAEEWVKVWKNIERKCLAKAEEYK